MTLGLQFRVQCAPGWDGSDCDVCMLDAECSTNDSSSNGQFPMHNDILLYYAGQGDEFKF